MGSWDVSVFGNDEAREWLSEVVSSTSTEPIFRALVSAAKVASDDYLQAPDCERALAAAELVAAARGKPSLEMPPQAKQWLAEQNFVAGTQIADLSIRVIDRISANSELKALWDDTDSAQDWYSVVRNLQQRLIETRDTPMDQQIAQVPEGSVESAFEEAAVLVAEGRYDEALAKYDQALALDPRSQMVYMGRGICHLWLEEYEKVVADINKALSLGQPLADAYNLRSQAFFHLEKYKNVVADLTSFLRVRANHGESYLIRGLAYERLQQFQNAISDFSQVIDRQSIDHLLEAHNHRAVCYEMLGRPDLATWDRQRAAQLESKSTHPS